MKDLGISIAGSLIATFLQLVIPMIIKAVFYRTPTRIYHLYPYVQTTVSLAFWLGSNILAHVFLPQYYLLAFFIATTIILIFPLWRREYQSYLTGYMGATPNFKSGVDYDEALRLCHSGLCFKGIGAAKLTNSREFKDAILRCNSDGSPIRFLLARPDNVHLANAAKRQNENVNAYKQKVIDSLRSLKNLKEDRAMNIEVRLYEKEAGDNLPLFRLMIINGSICFLSYYVLGEGDGSAFPQIVFGANDNKRRKHSLYFPFERYFERVWKDAQEWDFNEFL